MAGGRTGMDDVLEIANRALDAADGDRTRTATPEKPDFFHLFLFFLLLIAPFLFALLLGISSATTGRITFDPGEPAVANEEPTTLPPETTVTTAPATTTNSIAVVQPPTEVIEGPPVPVPAPEPPTPAPEPPAPEPPAPAPPHGG